MKLTIVQPQFAPNLYDLAAMLKADRVIWNDLEQWSRKGRTHRAVIKGEQVKQWINIPIKTEDKKKAIGEVRIEHDEDWIEPFWNAIYHSYSEATWFDFFVDELQHDIDQAAEFEKLLDFNIYFFERIMTYLELNIEYELASQVSGFDPNPDVFLEKTGADILYQEYDSKNYQWLSDQAKPALKEHPEYAQLGDGFLPECSIIDLLMNCGKESFKVFENIT
ncbi:WbqC family protein [Gracilimonas sediminicola]|uniref:WbqC family protein n=1 Tax=Gracilimonas sediminicola TaxID=2952158 RepID=A0A9X2L3U1_9BACT|nr:WbqC family protein [Gracilimonas sediminicola]MCP9291818.1 WbqC family protein [Gracilimonas sediminicola]